MSRTKVAALGVLVAVVPAIVAQVRTNPSAVSPVAHEAAYAVRWHLFWHHNEVAAANQHKGSIRGVGLLLPDRWVVWVQSLQLAVTILTSGKQDLLGPVIEVDESVLYRRTEDEALQHFRATHGYTTNGDCVGRVTVPENGRRPESSETKVLLPAERPCLEQRDWKVMARHELTLSVNDAGVASAPASASAAEDAVIRAVRLWLREHLPGALGIMTIPTVAFDIDPRVYVYLKGPSLQAILILQRGEDGLLGAFKLLERIDSVERYRKLIEGGAKSTASLQAPR